MCRHALCVHTCNYMIDKLPMQYVLDRWRNDIVWEYGNKTVQNRVTTKSSVRVDDVSHICQWFIEMVHVSDKQHEVVKHALNQAIQTCKKAQLLEFGEQNSKATVDIAIKDPVTTKKVGRPPTL